MQVVVAGQGYVGLPLAVRAAEVGHRVTTYTGTAEELLVPMPEETSGLKGWADFRFGFGPERIAPGNRRSSCEGTPTSSGRPRGNVGRRRWAVLAGHQPPGGW